MEFVEESTGGPSRPWKKVLLVLLIITFIAGAVVLIVLLTSNKSNTTSGMETFDEFRPLASFNWCGSSKTIALTFDDGPTRRARQLIEEMFVLGVPVTFFVSPNQDGKGPSAEQCIAIGEILSYGHDVQSHSWDHSDFTTLSNAQIAENLQRNKDWIQDCARRFNPDYVPNVNIFRPPFGNLSPDQAQFISKLGYSIATWNIDTYDYDELGATAISASTTTELATLQSQIRGDVSVLMLLHEKFYHGDDFSGTSQAVANIVSEYHSKGYTFVTASECYARCTGQGFGTVCEMPFQKWPGTFSS